MAKITLARRVALFLALTLLAPLAHAAMLGQLIKRITASDGVDFDLYGVSIAADGDVVAVGSSESALGSVYIYERNLSGTNTWTQVKKLTPSDPNAFSFGYAVAVAGDVIAVGAHNTQVGVNASQGAVFVYERNLGGTNNWGLAMEITASDGAADDWFGHRVAVAGDTLAVSADEDDIGMAHRQGSVYLYQRNLSGTNRWGFVKKLTAADGTTNDQFGASIAISGDTLLVGAANDRIGSNVGQGSAYLFERGLGGSNGWAQVVKLTAPGGTSNEAFGSAATIASDTVVIGAPLANVGTNNSQGYAYVFQRGAGGSNAWGGVAKLFMTNGVADDLFGEALALDGDLLAVGNGWWNGGDGAVHLFQRNARGVNAWGYTKTFTNAGAAFCNFGNAVAVAGDVIAAGANGDDIGVNEDQGAAYLYEYDIGNWQERATLLAADGASLDFAGQSLAVDGDVIALGVPSDDIGTAFDRGSLWLFARNTGGTNGWGAVRQITSSDGSTSDYFSVSIAIDGDTLACGAIGDATYRGAAYVFSRHAGGTNTWGEVRKITASDGVAGDTFGTSIDVQGDTIVVGAPFDESSRGAAYVFERNQGGTNTWGQVRKLTESGGSTNDYFGSSVSIDGDIIVVGVSDDDVGSNTNQGSAYIFERNHGGTNNWGVVRSIVPSDGTTNDAFGVSVSVDGDVIVVGASGDDAFKGGAYVFERNAGGSNRWGQVKKLTAPDGGAGETFGSSVAVKGGVIAVGAPDHLVSRGAIYMFERNSGGTNAWGFSRKLLALDGVANDAFGRTVAANGDVVAGGAIMRNNGGVSAQGAAYVYERKTIVDWNTHDLDILTPYPPNSTTTRVSSTSGSIITNRVSPLTLGATQYYGLGWTLLGHSPTGGAGTSVVITVTNRGRLTWRVGTNFWLTTSASTNGAVAPLSRWLTNGTIVSVTASPSAYYHFTNWTGNVVGGIAYVNPISVTMSMARTVTAFFDGNKAAMGTPEWWLAQHGWTNNFNSAETNDSDADQAAAWEEYQSDTVPTNGDSVLRMIDVSVTGTEIHVHWKGGVLATQYVDMATGSLETWATIATALPPRSVTSEMWMSYLPSSSYYRVRAGR
jgi:uncharacterized protein (DUF2345 family)